jgi:hypothetical protein
MASLRLSFCDLRIFAILLLPLGVGSLTTPARCSDFPPVPSDELKMTSEPKAPGASAIILYRQVDRDDSKAGTIHEDNYYRIKIFTEEGRKNADIEIPFIKGMDDVVRIQARTTKPDGSTVEFDGNVVDKFLVKARGLKVLARTFTLPAVEPGCVIEYSYTHDLQHAYDSHWILSESLYTKSARFSLKPYRGSYFPINLRWSWHNLPPGNQPKEGPDRTIRMDAADIQAFQTEDFMPPQNEVKSRVDFVYEAELPDRDPDAFWKRIGKKRNDLLESFIGKHKAMEAAVGEIISPDDPPETKLRKIYDRVQHLRNTSYEIRKTEQEEKRDKEKPIENVEELWKRGYGNGVQLTWLYLALVRAAGFEAYGCWVSDRRNYFFEPKTMESGKLDANVVLVKLNGKDLYFDPGGAFAPYGLLTWSETGVQGLRMDKDGGTWIVTSLPLSSESQIERHAKLSLTESGDLEGKLTVKYTGLEAMYHRLEMRNTDEVARKKFLEDAAKGQIPGTAEAELTNHPDWSNPETPLVAEFDLKVAGWAAGAGKRTILPAGLFSGGEKRLFDHAIRIHPIYFEYPYQKVDDIAIELPAGWLASSLPQPQTKDGHIVVYNLSVESDRNVLHISRKMTFDFLLLDVKYYASLRNFFQVVRNGDEAQIVLQTGSATASN